MMLRILNAALTSDPYSCLGKDSIPPPYLSGLGADTELHWLVSPVAGLGFHRASGYNFHALLVFTFYFSLEQTSHNKDSTFNNFT